MLDFFDALYVGAPRAMPIALSPGHRALMGRNFQLLNKFVLDPMRSDLRSGRTLQIGHQAEVARAVVPGVLTMLLEHPERCEPRATAAEAMPQETFVDFDHGLNAAVERLRRCLNDSAACPTFIETLPGAAIVYRQARLVEASVPVRSRTRTGCYGQHRRRTIFLVRQVCLATLLSFFLGARGWKRVTRCNEAVPASDHAGPLLPFQNLRETFAGLLSVTA